MAITQVKAAGLTADLIDETKLADNSIDSEHYNDGSIDHAHLANDAVDGDNIADDAVNSEHYVDASIDHQHLADDCVDGDNIADNSVGLAAMAHGTDGQIITYDASGAPVAVGPGTDGQVLTSTGAGSPPAFEDAGGGLDGVTTGSGNVTISDGNLIVAAGHGIDFSADAGGGSSGSAGSELLDDYEHGSWTPTYSDGSSYIDTGSSNFQYIKIGDLVNLWGNIRTNGSATGTAQFYVQSIPFSSVNSVGYSPIGPINGDNGWSEDLSDSNMVCNMSHNSANLRLWKNSGDTVGSITLNNIGPNANLMFTITYRST